MTDEAPRSEAGADILAVAATTVEPDVMEPPPPFASDPMIEAEPQSRPGRRSPARNPIPADAMVGGTVAIPAREMASRRLQAARAIAASAGGAIAASAGGAIAASAGGAMQNGRRLETADVRLGLGDAAMAEAEKAPPPGMGRGVDGQEAGRSRAASCRRTARTFPGG